jgi:hypothetical protein
MFEGNGRITKAIWLTISGWIISLRARRRIKKSLGRKATDLELASLKTWMAVDEAEQGKRRVDRFIPVDLGTGFEHLTMQR